MNSTLKDLPSPAKLNLFLHILGRRPDGYHNLQTCFQLLDYGDTLSLALRRDGEIKLNTAFVDIPLQDNLIYKAAVLLQNLTGTTAGVDIDIQKRIPSGAGLGGGSSNAATVLVGLNQLWNAGLSTGELADAGLQLGADVPVFIHGHSAWAEGVGENITPITLPEKWFLVVSPPCSVSTAKIFCSEELTRNTSPITIAAFLDGVDQNACQTNDCQAVVEQLYPAVKSALDWFGQSSPPQLTGTGSAIFACFTNEADAKTLLKMLPADLKGFVAKGVNHSPLYERLNR